MEVEFYDLTADVQQKIKECEGVHVQQVAYSSYHESLTQICFGCNRIRTSLKKEDTGWSEVNLKLNSEQKKTCATKHVIPPKPKDSGILPNFT